MIHRADEEAIDENGLFGGISFHGKRRNCSCLIPVVNISTKFSHAGGWKKNRHSGGPLGPGTRSEDNQKISTLNSDESGGHKIRGENGPKRAPKRPTYYLQY